MSSEQTDPILAVGTIGIDTIRTPQEEVPEVLGGSGMFFATAATLLAPVNLVSVVG